jgi:hypothetical protein
MTGSRSHRFRMPNCKRHRTSPHGRGPINCWCRCISCIVAVTREQDTHTETITVFITVGRGILVLLPRAPSAPIHIVAKRGLLRTSPITTVDGRPGSVATKWSSVSHAEYRRDPFRSHLLTARAHGGANALHIGEEGPRSHSGTAPLSSELRHHTAYPAQSNRKPLGLNP